MQIAGVCACGRHQIVEHVGFAHTEAELGMLLQRARELLDNPAQGGSSRLVGKWIPGQSVMPPSWRHFSRE